jgi:hypothetical protein
LGGHNVGPIERNAWIARFDISSGIGIERRSADLDARRRPEPVQDPRSTTVTAVAGLHEVDMLVASPIP